MATLQFNEEERSRLALLVMDVLQEWQLDSEDQLTILGLKEKGRLRDISKYKQGRPFPEDQDVLNRAKHVLGIQHSLHVIFPRNNNMPSFWMKNRNRALKGRPLEIMLEEGVPGMFRIWRHLDCTLNWD